MTARNGLLIRIEDQDGAFGWGEAWCNFPPHASESRKHLLDSVIAPGLVGERFGHVGDVRKELEKKWARMALHVGEPGPFSHCIAGIDIALWDLVARREGRPLSALLQDAPADRVKVYASTLDVARAPELAGELIDNGHRAFKLKVGLDPENDQKLVHDVRNAIGDEHRILVDANQNWSLEEAVTSIGVLSRAGLTFVEEPILAAATPDVWRELAQRSPVSLAAGENINSLSGFASHLENGTLTFFQPDVAKWGGVSGCFEVGQTVRNRGAVYCPHYMGTAVGLAASLHLLAAVGGDGYVELDSNSNPLRTDLCDINLAVSEGQVSVPEGHGIGIVPDTDALRQYNT